ncbi:YraN family protein [uncultured Amnibacterium sp.]|uniref:YraN family protein n=1 Tax=uncultured Amnibacterium sp. TaxID=1631851 RepID=UPI0035C97ED6
MAQKDDLGRRGEQQAAAYLTSLGYRILDRNWRCPTGEIDIVAMDRGELVVVEVKTRSTLAYGDPLEAVTDAKLTRLCVLAGAWRRAHRGVRANGTRIDLVGVLLPRHAEPVLDHLRAAA